MIDIQLKKLLSKKFRNVYCSNIHRNNDSEEIRIDLISSNLVENNPGFETRSNTLDVRYYTNIDLKKENNKQVLDKKNQNIYNLLSVSDNLYSNWLNLDITNIDYNFQAEEIEDLNNINVTRYSLDINSVIFPGEISQLEIPEIPGPGDLLIPGDANLSGNVNVSDIVLLVQFILSDYPTTTAGWVEFSQNASNVDMDQDGQVNVSDIVNIVNIIIGENQN